MNEFSIINNNIIKDLFTTIMNDIQNHFIKYNWYLVNNNIDIDIEEQDKDKDKDKDNNNNTNTTYVFEKKLQSNEIIHFVIKYYNIDSKDNNRIIYISHPIKHSKYNYLISFRDLSHIGSYIIDKLDYIENNFVI
jgi:hypothetical protein